MKIDKNTLNILKSYIRVCENHAEKLQLALLETQNHVPFTSESFEKINAVDTSFLKVVTSLFSRMCIRIEFVQQVAALLCDRVKILLQQIAGERSHENKEFCASTACTIKNFIPRLNN